MTDANKAAAAARLAVKAVYPHATSAYTGRRSAMVYDGRTDAVLGTSDAQEDSVELAWVDAMRRLAAHQPPNTPAQAGVGTPSDGSLQADIP